MTEKLFHEGVHAFNAGRYFDAHEFWEDLWQPLPAGAEKTLLHGLIQLSVALHHRGNNNDVGFKNLLEKACNNFSQFRKSGEKLPEVSVLKKIDSDGVMVQAFLLATEPDDNTLLIKIKSKTPGL